MGKNAGRISCDFLSYSGSLSLAFQVRARISRRNGQNTVTSQLTEAADKSSIRAIY